MMDDDFVSRTEEIKLRVAEKTELKVDKAFKRAAEIKSRMNSKDVEKGRRGIWPQAWNEISLSGERGAGVSSVCRTTAVVRGDIVRVLGRVPECRNATFGECRRADNSKDNSVTGYSRLFPC